MAEVTKITKQKKNQEYYNIYIDGEYQFSLHQELVILYGVKKGKRLDVEEMEEIILEDQKKRAFNLCLHYLSYTRRTQWQLEEYLQKKDFSPEVIQRAIEKLKYYNMIDDKVYVQSYIAEKKLGNPISRKKLIFDLEKKGIQKELLNNLEQWFTNEEEYEQAQRLVKKYNKKYKKLSPRERTYKIGQAGQRRGFSWEIMKEAMQDIVIDSNEGENQHSQSVDRDKAFEWGKKYKKRYGKKGVSGFALKGKIMQALRRRGYSWEIIEEVLKEVLYED